MQQGKTALILRALMLPVMSRLSCMWGRCGISRGMWLSLSTSFRRVAICVFVSCVFGYGVVLPWGGEMPGAQVIQYAQACKWAAITSVVIAQASLRFAHSCSRFRQSASQVVASRHWSAGRQLPLCCKHELPADAARRSIQRPTAIVRSHRFPRTKLMFCRGVYHAARHRQAQPGGR